MIVSQLRLLKSSWVMYLFANYGTAHACVEVHKASDAVAPFGQTEKENDHARQTSAKDGQTDTDTDRDRDRDR